MSVSQEPSAVADVTFAIAPRTPEHKAALERLFERVSELSALPGVAQRVLNVTNDATADAEDLLHVVEQDPTLVMRILRTVNSPYCGLRSEVADLRSALAVLGFKKVRSLALTVYVARLLDGQPGYLGYSRENLWRHLVTVGEIARVISRVCNRAVPDEAYLAGLLHDLGYLLADQYMHSCWRRVLEAAADDVPLETAERDVLTFNCADLSAFMATKCCLPSRTALAIAYHRVPDRFLGRDRELLNVLAAANFVAESRGVTAIGRPTAPTLPDDVARGLGLRGGQLAELLVEIEPALEAAEALAGI
ncbi:MAG: HDOD domain-containing protein [Planctomycetales bacterium]|nr:HDOD domain-containing protein [Planctomycetales bacterium]